MKKRKIVGICSSVGNKAKATNNTYPIIFINRIFIEISHSYNLIPIILSPTVDISEIEQMANMIDFLILTGGEDIHPQFYNEVINYDYYEYNACNPTLERDYFEIQLYSISKSLGKSILGICRGMQIINISEGGTLCQNIDTYLEYDGGNSSDYINDYKRNKLTNPKYCIVGDSSLFITYNGDILGCFQDFSGKCIVANIRNSNLKDIIKHKKDKVGRYEFCSNCNSNIAILNID